MVESTMRAIISLGEAVELVEDEDCTLGADSQSEISKDGDPSFINHQHGMCG